MTTSTMSRVHSTSSAVDEPPSNNAANMSGDDGGGRGGSGHREQNNGSSRLEKTDSDEDTWSSTGYTYINPFVHRLRINNRIDWAKIYVLTVLLLPIRVVGCVLSLLSAWMFACIGLYGYTLDDLKAKPLAGWRKRVQHLAAASMRLLFASGSFHYITSKGQRATPKEAPILVVAPHSSYVDSIVVVAAGPPSIVAKQETSKIPLLGKIINYAQPIYVQREDPNSRQNTIKEIVERARSAEEWPQVVIFSEGTCTNRSALIKFKPGAFYAGVPVQPVLLKYPNKFDTYTWTWDGPGVLRLLWLTMSQFYSRCEIEYLPVYTPNEEEKADANLFANNVRDSMAKALNVPTSEYSFEDVIMMSRAKEMKIPFPGDIVEIERVLFSLGLLDSNRDAELTEDFLSMSLPEIIDIGTFAELLKLDLNSPHLHRLYAVLDHRHSGTISLKSFLLCSLFCKLKNEDIASFLRAIVKLYSQSSQNISRQSLCKILRHTGKIVPGQSDAIYFFIDYMHTGYISFDEFIAEAKRLSTYDFIFKEREHIRRAYQKKK